MTTETFQREMKKLSAAYGRELTGEMMSVYWAHINHFADAMFERICESILVNETFFPAIAVFKKHEKRNLPIGERDINEFL